jgi:hypothetical protein
LCVCLYCDSFIFLKNFFYHRIIIECHNYKYITSSCNKYLLNDKHIPLAMSDFGSYCGEFISPTSCSRSLNLAGRMAQEVKCLSSKCKAARHWWLTLMNPSYSGSRDQEDHSSKPAQANRSQDSILKNPITKTGLVDWLKV